MVCPFEIRVQQCYKNGETFDDGYANSRWSSKGLEFYQIAPRHFIETLNSFWNSASESYDFKSRMQISLPSIEVSSISEVNVGSAMLVRVSKME